MSRTPALALLILVAVLGLWLAAAPVAVAQEPPTQPTPVATPTPTPTPTPEGDPAPDRSGGLFGLLPDPKQWAADVFNQVLVDLLRGISDALRKVVGGVLGSSLNFITQTPPAGTYASPTVQTLWGVVRTIANAALVLVALWGGFNLIVREQLGSPYHDAMELVPRLLVGALLANTSLSWAQLAIDANNALCQAIGQASLPAWERADTATQLLVDVIAVLIYLVVGLLLLLQMLMRLALVDVLLVASPLALLCWVLPQTQGWARQWSSAFFGAVFTQFVQVLALKLGGSLLTELAPMAPDAALLAVFLGIAVLVLTLKIPGLMRHHAGDGLGFARYLVYRQAARAVEGRGRAKGGA
ncbi:MAG: hypothetical protein KatS3mg060_2334 [Dehalococcoidia bacterium]|nr:MAG: hypothetical protein KatS3mg060_2334 [Dehalococcoidia bacterium]